MVLGPRKFDGKTYAHVICVDSRIRKNAVISNLKERGYLYRAIKEGTYRNPIWCIYKRRAAKIRKIQEYRVTERTYPTTLVATRKTKKAALSVAQKRSDKTPRTITVTERATLGGYDDSYAIAAFKDGKCRRL